MDFIRQIYPNILEAAIDAALDYANGDVYEAVDILGTYLREETELDSMPSYAKLSTVSPFITFLEMKRAEMCEVHCVSIDEPRETMENTDPMLERWHLGSACANGSQCCFSEVGLSKTTICSNSGDPHRFCFDCARKYTETEIGHGK